MKEKIFIKQKEDSEEYRIILVEGPIPPEIMERENIGRAK
tara:strand:+ start:850 stop:969 length:120 start_codon:yes stop_codon:yes gene_type:complete